MLTERSAREIHLACGATDLRKSIDGLAATVQHSFDLDPFSDSWFVFCNKGRNKLKLLRWDHNGFWLYYRGLERGSFCKRPNKKGLFATFGALSRRN
jgi:transposase